MKQLEVTIVGQSYLLACPEGGEAPLQAAVAMVDREMSAIRNAGKVRARERIAVLAALNLAYLLVQQPASPGATPPRDEDAPMPNADDEALLQQLIHRIDDALAPNNPLP